MDFLRPENLLRHGYKDCVLCEVERKGEEKRCERCSGRLDQRERLLWEIHGARIRRTAGRLALVFPGLGHCYAGRIGTGLFWSVLFLAVLVLAGKLWAGVTTGHGFLLLAVLLTWFLSWRDARKGVREPVAPCEGACPSHIRVPDYIALVRENRPVEALALVHDKLPFAAFCGRACPHPCELECVRNEFGAPIAIMAIKRYAADLGYAEGILPSPVAGGRTPPKVAVIGAGSAGMSAADTLARLGARVTVFDPNEEPGGTMRYGVAEFRFPVEALLSDVRHILARGIEFRGGKTFGEGVTFDSLEQEGFESAVVAVGTREPVRLPGAGGEAEGFFDALPFLRRVRAGRPQHLLGRVVVIGGGSVAVDAARTALRMGGADVTIACVESREEMPAYSWEVEDAVAEGVRILSGVAAKQFSYRSGRVSGFEALRVERVDVDPKGRVVPHTVPGSEFAVRADVVVTAIGSRPSLGFLPPATAWKSTDAQHHVFRLIFPGGGPRIPIYACGDCACGPGTVVEASASGRAAALNVYTHLRVEEVGKTRYADHYRRRFEPQETDRPAWRVRLKAERMPPEESRGNFNEVQKGFTGECARMEAERCARCNLYL